MHGRKSKVVTDERQSRVVTDGRQRRVATDGRQSRVVTVNVVYSSEAYSAGGFICHVLCAKESLT